MYATDDGECKFGKAIPLPSYHHVHQVGGLICGACGIYIKKDSAYIYCTYRDSSQGGATSTLYRRL